MASTLSFNSSLRSRGPMHLFCAAAFLALSAHAATKTPPDSSLSLPEREFRLFVGVDVKAMLDEELETVVDFANHRARLGSSNGPALPVNRLKGVSFVHATKLSRNTLQFSEIETELAWGKEQDAGDWMRQQANLQGYGDDRIDSLHAGIAAAASLPSGTTVNPDGSVVNHGDPLGDANQALSNFTTQNSQLNNPDFYADKIQDQQAGLHNALVIETTLSSPVPIADAYLVGIVRVRTDEEGLTDVMLFQDIGLLGPKEKKIRIRKEDMPQGFEVQDIKLHVYREGQELASDLSEKQFALTRDDALAYLTLERVSSNRGKTLPAEPAWALAPSSLLGSDRPNAFDFPLTVHIDAKGRMVKVDESTIVPGQISEIVADLLFLPAIENGIAVASVAHINLRDFFR